MAFKVASRVRGLSDEAFRMAFGTEEQCRAALVRLRWPDGFVCPSCGHRRHCELAGRGLYQRNRCKRQTSPTASTIFHSTKLPLTLTLWFAAIHLIATAKNGVSSVELGGRLGVKQPTAWAMNHKIMAVMARREGATRLGGRVEMDDAYLGDRRSGKRGRGAAGKTSFVAAVSTGTEGRPRKLKLAPVRGFRKRESARGAEERWLVPGSEVVTDGYGYWRALDEGAYTHRAIRTGSGPGAARVASFTWVNTTLGNVTGAITGTYRKIGPDHAERYLASFAGATTAATTSRL